MESGSVTWDDGDDPALGPAGSAPAGSLASSLAIFAGAARRQLDHALTAEAFTALGFPPPSADELAEAAAMRTDTLRRQADPAIRRTLAAVLRRLQ